ncbi:hypothetical protein BgiMline_033471 [Biomphalaria glabrata]
MTADLSLHISKTAYWTFDRLLTGHVSCPSPPLTSSQAVELPPPQAVESSGWTLGGVFYSLVACSKKLEEENYETPF